MCKSSILFLVAIIVLFCSCKKDKSNTAKEVSYNFQSNAEGWTADFADYPNDPNVEIFYELHFSHAMLPNPLNTNDGALKQAGNNHSDDLFMFVKKKVTGLEPNKIYSISIEIEIASNAASGRAGVGGAPGEGVAIKAGASTIEPAKVLDNTDNYYRMNVNKDNQGTDGPNIKVIGNFANGTDFDVYKLKQLATSAPVRVQSNSNGELWLIVGTDSGFEALTTIYYNYIKATLR